MSHFNNPLVTVNILSYNRKEELRFTLKKVYEQDYRNIEVIVVDNASEDGTQDMIREEYPNVRLIELEENIGIAGWNRGFEAAKGEYVLVLDDDSYPENGTVEAGMLQMLANDKVAVIGFTIYNSYFDLIENSEDYNLSNGEIIEVLGFIGCGALIRKNIFIELNGFESLIFLYYNELDFSIRAKNVDYSILFDPNHRVVHIYSKTNREEKDELELLVSERRYEHTFKSYFIYLYKNFNSRAILKYSAKLLLSKLYVALKLGYFTTFIKSIVSILPLMLLLRKSRNPVADHIQKEYNYGNLRFRELNAYYERK